MEDKSKDKVLSGNHDTKKVCHQMAKERNYTPLKELITQNPSILQKKDKREYTILTIVFLNVMQSLHSKEDLDMFDWLTF